MHESRIKAMHTRTQRLSKAFEAEHGRLPTVKEIGELVSAEMSAAQAKSRENYSGDGGFRSMSKERLSEVSREAAKKRWHGKG